MISVTYKTDEWNKVTTAVLNTYTLARLKTFTFYKVHNNFNFPHSNNVINPYFTAQHANKNEHYCMINFSKII